MPCKHVVESCSTIASKCIHTSYRFRWCEYSSLQNETVIEEKDKEKKSLDESLTILQEDLDQAQAKYAKTKAELEQTLADLNDM